MSFSPTRAAVRFGYGLSPEAEPPGTVDAMMADLLGRDEAVRTFPRRSLDDRITILTRYRRARRMSRQSGTEMADEMTARTGIRERTSEDFIAGMARALSAPVGFRERLVAFWSDHFNVSAKNRSIGLLIGSHQDHAIRPHVATTFGRMLAAVMTHPAMLVYLDQGASVGPNSRRAQRLDRGLNENLAREVLELHTLGVDAGYSQGDVRELAELLTGFRVTRRGFVFAPGLAEPGAETVLGKSYGGGRRAQLEDVTDALHDLALRPETAEHLATKLAVHFISDRPDPDLVRSMVAAYRAHDGALLPVYEAMLAHPAAWAREQAKVKPPYDFVASGLRALGVGPDALAGAGPRRWQRWIGKPLTSMGQTPMRAPGPDGWPEEAEAWITPATLSARIAWAASVARRFGRDRDPRRFLEETLGELAGEDLRFAVAGAEAKWEGRALVLASPAFNRR